MILIPFDNFGKAMNLQADYFFDLAGFSHGDLFNQGGYPWLILNQLSAYLKTLSLGRIEGEVSSSAHLINKEQIFIGEGSIVEPGAYIQGPCWIGKGCTIRHGAYIRGHFLAGDHCVVGHDTEVKNAIFLPHAHAAHFAYVGDTILGRSVNLGAGVKCANFKLDQKLIVVEVEDRQIATQMRKLGALVGDYCQIGCNSVLNPGTLMGKNVHCYPCINVGGWIPSKSIIKPTNRAAIVPLIKKN